MLLLYRSPRTTCKYARSLSLADISLLTEIVDKSESKEDIYYSLGLEKAETIKKQKGLKKSEKKDKETVEDFLKNNFKTIKIER